MTRDLTALAALLSDRVTAYTKASAAYTESQSEVTRAGLALKEAIERAEPGLHFFSGDTLYVVATRNGKNYIKLAVPSKAGALLKGTQRAKHH